MLELYDCTLREGEQSAGASFDLNSRIELFKKLDEFGFDYIELGWPIASEEILKSFELCSNIAKKAKIVAFGSTAKGEIESDENLKSIIKSKAKYACIFGKTHIEHVEKQLKISPKENLKKIFQSIKFLKEKGLSVFYDAEHYFDAFKVNEEYSVKTLIAASKAGALKLILCDTNGALLPKESRAIIEKTKHIQVNRGIEANLELSFHDDQGLALANTLASLKFISQVQGTINGIGERIGNLNFSTFIPIYSRKIGKLNVKLESIKELNEEAYRLSGLDIPESRPFVGETAFAHKGGVHIDATNKGASYEHSSPENFGNKRIILLNSLGGLSAIIGVARQFGYDLDKKDLHFQKSSKELYGELKELEQKGYRIGALPAEQFLLIEKYFGNLTGFFSIKEWNVLSSMDKHGKRISEYSVVHLKGKINGKNVNKKLKVKGGPVDAAYKTLLKILSKSYPEIKKLKLVDFHVGIARRKAEESTVRTCITFQDTEEFQTVGVDSNILESAFEALEKGFRYYLNNQKRQI